MKKHCKAKKKKPELEFSEEFLESLARAEEDYKAGRFTELKSLKDLGIKKK